MSASTRIIPPETIKGWWAIYFNDIQYLPDGGLYGYSGTNGVPQREGATAGAGNLPKTDPASALLNLCDAIKATKSARTLRLTGEKCSPSQHSLYRQYQIAGGVSFGDSSPDSICLEVPVKVV
jgi:hypothetical protein